MSPQYLSRQPHARAIAIGMMGPATAGAALLAYYLGGQHRWYAATGWAILATVFAFFLMLALVRRDSRARLADHEPDLPCVRLTGNPESPVVVLRSPDPLLVAAAKRALEAQGIDAVLLDEQSASLMRFLPDVQLRLVVAEKFAKEAGAIVRRARQGTRDAEPQREPDR